MYTTNVPFAKLTYSPPLLIEHGDLRKLTQSGTTKTKEVQNDGSNGGDMGTKKGNRP